MPSSRLPRLYYVHPWLLGPPQDWGALLDRCAEMGFDHVLLGPPFETGRYNNLFVSSSFDRLHPALGIEGFAIEGIGRLAAECRARGLSLLFDLVIDRVAGDGDIVRSHGAWFQAEPDDFWNPHRANRERGRALLRWSDAEVSEAALPWWTRHLRALLDAGVAGFRCEGLSRAPASVWRRLIDAAHETAPSAVFLAWTQGLSWEEIDRLAGVGFDAGFSSDGWWDFRSPWLVGERAHLRRLGPAISVPETPFAQRLAARVGQDQVAAAYRRALWFAALQGDGILIPMGFEYASADPLETDRGGAGDLDWMRNNAPVDLSDEIRAVNQILAAEPDTYVEGELRQLTPPGAEAAALLRIAAAGGATATARMITVNTRISRDARLSPEAVLPAAGSAFGLFRQSVPPGDHPLEPGSAVTLHPGEVRAFDAGAAAAITLPPETVIPLDYATRHGRVAIESISPSVDGGEFPAKRTVGESVRVEADVITDGHDELAASVLWRTGDSDELHEVRMHPLGNDRWAAEFPLERLGRHFFAVEAWRDAFGTYRSELTKKRAAGLRLSLEIEEGRRLVTAWAATERGRAACLTELVHRLEAASEDERLSILLSDSTLQAMRAADPRPFAVRSAEHAVDAERIAARFSSWYELFPRSQSGDPNRHGTFRDVIGRLPAIRDMGFDVLYFPPIHPIGRTNRKGRNNTLHPEPGDPGSPYAIGSEEGGHDALHPELGSFEDFQALRAAAAEHGIELALDFAIQCSPDHPWLKEHPDWFNWRPDGTIRYAENPPKKYEDIVNVDFYGPGAVPDLWVTLRNVVEFWIGQGVKIFRVDNPHTKPLPFWHWMIDDLRARYPDAIFLAEAFTRPKLMYRLAKIGFSQSYTYFTWRNHKQEIAEYLVELSTTAPKDFFRPHFFVNTPDINPDFLQNAPRPAYLIRAALATTLSGLWGLYNGFELCEGRPDRTRKEYADSEKYELKAWDYDRPGNIVAEITRLNQIRKANPALQTHLGVTFYNATNDRIIYYGKATPNRDNVVLVAINLDPHNTQEAMIELPLWEFGLPDHGAFETDDLMADRSFTWRGKYQFVRLDPAHNPFAIWRIRPAEA